MRRNKAVLAMVAMADVFVIVGEIAKCKGNCLDIGFNLHGNFDVQNIQLKMSNKELKISGYNLEDN